MEILSDYEDFLHNPPFLSRIASLWAIEKVSQVYSFWKWGALIIALVATFSSIINRIKFLIIKFKTIKPAASEPLLRLLEDDDYGSEDDTCSSTSSDGEADEPTSPFQDPKDYCVAGSCSGSYDEDQWQNRKSKLRRRRSGGDRFSWSDFANGKSVVKLWDGLGLGLDLENSSGSLISIWDLNENQTITSFFGGRCQIPAVSMASTAVVVSAGLNNSKNVALSVWDARVGRQIPAMFAEWGPQQGKIVGINSGGVEKVYVRDDASSALTIGDMRNVNSPLENLTESDRDTWWDADAVIVPDDCVDESVVNGCGSVVTRCRDPVRSYLS